MPRITPARGCIGCANSMTLLGGFGAGVYVGYHQAHGFGIDLPFANALFYGPSLLAGTIGFISGVDLASDRETLGEIMSNFPIEMERSAVGLIRGCGPIFSTFGSAAITLFGTYIGYSFGKSLG